MGWVWRVGVGDEYGVGVACGCGVSIGVGVACGCRNECGLRVLWGVDSYYPNIHRESI